MFASLTSLRAFAVGIAAVAGLLAFSPVADARIVPQVGIGGAKLGMTQKQVRSKLGKPDSKRILNSPIGGFDFVQLKYGRTKVSFDGTAKSSKVLSVVTRDESEKTKAGVGIGSTKERVRKRVPDVRCKKEFGVNHCWVGSFKPGRTVTDFRLQRKHGDLRVAQVGVGIVLD